MTRCVVIKADGERCATDWALNADGLCPAHDPERSVSRRVGAARSAEVRQAKAEVRRNGPIEGMPEGPPQSLDDCAAWTSWVMWAVATGKLDKSAAQQITNAAREFRSTLEKRDLEREQAELKAGIRELQKLVKGR